MGLVIFLGWMFVAYLAPKIKEWSVGNGAYTLGDYLAHRYNERTRTIVSSVIVIGTLISISVQLIAFAGLAEVITGLPFYIGLVLATLITIIYTSAAGIKGDFYTDAIQFFVMIPVFLLLFVRGFKTVGFETFTSLPQGFWDPFNYAGLSFFFGALIFGIPILAVSMDSWQKIFASSDGRTARKAFICSGFINILFTFSAVTVGLLAYHLAPGVAPDSAVYVLMHNVLPSGALGLGFASLLAVIMSSIDTGLMIGSATVTKDFYLRGKGEVSDSHKLKAGRVAAIAFGLVAFVIALTFQDIVRLVVIAAQIVIIFAPAVVGGLLWKRSSAAAAFWSVFVGFVLTILLMFKLPDTAFIPAFIVTVIVFIVVSLRSNRQLPGPILPHSLLKTEETKQG